MQGNFDLLTSTLKAGKFEGFFSQKKFSETFAPSHLFFMEWENFMILPEFQSVAIAADKFKSMAENKIFEVQAEMPTTGFLSMPITLKVFQWKQGEFKNFEFKSSNVWNSIFIKTKVTGSFSGIYQLGSDDSESKIVQPEMTHYPIFPLQA